MVYENGLNTHQIKKMSDSYGTATTKSPPITTHHDHVTANVTQPLTEQTVCNTLNIPIN